MQIVRFCLCVLLVGQFATLVVRAIRARTKRTSQKMKPAVAIIHLVVLLFGSSSSLAGNEADWQNKAETSVIELNKEPIQPLPLYVELDSGKVALGERLFNDARLSSSGGMSCVSCHNLNLNGADGLKNPISSDGSNAHANTLTIFNSGFNHRLFWDARAKTLEDQVGFVVSNPAEFSTTWPEIVAKLKQDISYPSQFNAVYADGVTAENIRNAIADFQRSLITPNSRFDRYLRGENNAITEEEKTGYRLFKMYGCVACHQGKNVGGNLLQKLGAFKTFFIHEDKIKKVDLGHFNVTGLERDRHVFRVPSLRLAALTPPYFHDGSAKTLKDAIKVMAEYQLGRLITDQDIDYIIAFLKTLPGEYKGKQLSGYTKTNQVEAEHGEVP